MKKIAFIAVAIAVVGLGVFYALAGNNDQNTNPMTSDTVSQENEQTNGQEGQPLTRPAGGQYIDYKDGVIESTGGTKLLFFHAPWCPQCQALEADIKAQGVPSGVNIIKVDYDTSQNLRQKYGVTIQTTVVKVDDSGNLVDKYVAYDYPTLQSVADNLL